MLDSFDVVPAYMVGRRTDVLAWNRPAHSLLAGHLEYDAPHGPADSRPPTPRHDAATRVPTTERVRHRGQGAFPRSRRSRSTDDGLCSTGSEPHQGHTECGETHWGVWPDHPSSFLTSGRRSRVEGQTWSARTVFGLRLPRTRRRRAGHGRPLPADRTLRPRNARYP
ncbi:MULTISPECIES: hypothetical protein [unclassified Streptomyces]|uniref:MmyB family transcriptional regulator n=1 Tax=unclassified Streptomyces TaxID=2593676 RepID=UPI0035D98786